MDATGQDTIAQGVKDLIVSGSFEIASNQSLDVSEYAKQLPSGMSVYVHHSAGHRLSDSHATLKAVRLAGLDPVPHIAARRLASRAELESFLRRATGECGISKVFLIGGDVPQPLGPYASGVDLLEEEILAAHGIRQIGLPGYPEGHPTVPKPQIDQAISRKLALIATQGLSGYIVTQFSFAPARIVQYCSELARRIPSIPVYVGLAGPTETKALLHWAQLCGVSASLRALQAMGIGAIRFATHEDPRDQLVAVVRHCLGHKSSNVVGAHFFTFGGAAKTVAWINREISSGGASQARTQ